MSAIKKDADLDRAVTRIDVPIPERTRLSGQRHYDRYVLLGEPGIGKSTAFAREAAAAGTMPVSAMAFVRGTRPTGAVIFIDALEEYRIGEAGIDRLQDLIDALQTSAYSGWRIACRAISLPPSDAARIAAECGAFAKLQLDLLDTLEQHALLNAIGVVNSGAFVERVMALGADTLLGNPATLILLAKTIDRATTPPATRSALLAEATRQMSHEINPHMPERPHRAAPAQIEAAAEAASLVLMLSARTDLYLYSTLPPHDATVTRDDLLAGRVDIAGLLSAVDTPMFKSDGVIFQPSHRIIAEYLAGRALARAVVPPDGTTSALPLYRALGFCCGDNDRPAPALTGVFAWFVTELAHSRRPELAADLIPLDPEAVLFHGDAAVLPTEQRVALLVSVGRGDPWFLGAAQGSSAIGSLAGDDLAAPMRALLDDPRETPHRRAMVLEALSKGRPVKALAETVREIVTTPSSNEYFRLRALEAYLKIVGDTVATRKALLASLSAEPAETASPLRVQLARTLVEHGELSADAIRTIISDYSTTGDRTMGYAQGLSHALQKRPIPALFDKPLGIRQERAAARSSETRTLIDHVLADTIRQTPVLEGARLVRWIINAKGHEDQIDGDVVAAIGEWLDQDLAHEGQLYDALEESVERREERFWRADSDFRQLSGRPVSDQFRVAAVEAVEEGAADQRAVERAIQLVQPYEDNTDLYWRLVAALERDPAMRDAHKRLTIEDIAPWRLERAERTLESKRKEIERRARDRDWLRPRIAEMIRGELPRTASFAAEIYHGLRYVEGTNGIERIQNWLGHDTALIAAIKGAMQACVAGDASTVEIEGKAAASTSWPSEQLVVAVWVDWQLCDGLHPTISFPQALRILHCGLGIDVNRDALRAAALDRIASDPDAQALLTRFWRAAIGDGATNLPLSHQLDASLPAVKAAAVAILSGRQTLQPDILRDLLTLAAPGMTADDLLGVAQRMIARAKRVPGHQIWALIAFLLDPARHAGLLGSHLSDETGAMLLLRLWDGHFREVQALASDRIVARSEALVRHLGPSVGPHDRLEDPINRPSELVANALAALARELSDDAVAALSSLSSEPTLAAWADSIRHRLEQQAVAVRKARFTPPLPKAVAQALAAGPPASPADLRAVVRHTIEDLATTIRRSDTSSWRLFWNTPDKATMTPRVENDCRDLLVDRLRDRLERYGIPVRMSSTETRSMDNMRSDLVVLGNGSAAVPVEAKRHWNDQIWTAADKQLVPYGLASGSSGHGILMIFWFGIDVHKVPAPPGGGTAPTTPDELRKALLARLGETQRGKIDVVVIDLSQATAVERAKRVQKGQARRQFSGRSVSPKARNP